MQQSEEGLLPACNPCAAATWLEPAAGVVQQQQQSPDEFFVVEVLKRLPALQLLQLDKCRHLLEEGQALARQCCGRYSPAVVAYR